MKLQMGIIKIEVKIPELMRALEEFEVNRVKSLEVLTSEVKTAVENTFHQLLNAEMTLFLGRPDQRENKRNGFEEKTYALKGIVKFALKCPWTGNPALRA